MTDWTQEQAIGHLMAQGVTHQAARDLVTRAACMNAAIEVCMPALPDGWTHDGYTISKVAS